MCLMWNTSFKTIILNNFNNSGVPLLVLTLEYQPFVSGLLFFFFFFFNIFFGVPHLATFISFFIEYVIASIAYIHPVHGGIWTHDLLDVSLLL